MQPVGTVCNVCNMYKTLVSPDLAEKDMPYANLWHLSHFNGRKPDRDRDKSLILCVPGLALSYNANCIRVILVGMLPAYSCVIKSYMYGMLKATCDHESVCSLESCQRCGEPCFAGAAISRDRCLPGVPKEGQAWVITNVRRAVWQARINVLKALEVIAYAFSV
jgi:hypothetical protein